jgi:hypothetical protein
MSLDRVKYFGCASLLLLGRLEPIYVYVDGEVKLNKMVPPHPTREIAVWVAAGDAFGSWRFTLLLARDGELYLKQEWVQVPGYKWREVRIYKVVGE